MQGNQDTNFVLAIQSTDSVTVKGVFGMLGLENRMCGTHHWFGGDRCHGAERW